MASSAAPAQPGPSGPLSFIGCMRQSSPPPAFDYQRHQQQTSRPRGLPSGPPDYGPDCAPKEPRKRRFQNPLRGLRRIFRRRSRGAADPLQTEDSAARGQAEDGRSRSASELLGEACERQRRLLARPAHDDPPLGSLGQLSVSHDSVFPGERAPQPASLQRRSTGTDQHEEACAQQQRTSLRVSWCGRASLPGVDGPAAGLQVLEQIKSAIERRQQNASSATPSTDRSHNRLSGRADKVVSSSSSSSASIDLEVEEARTRQPALDEPEDSAETHVPRRDAPTPAADDCSPETSPLKEDLPESRTGQLSHTAALHRISVRPKNRRPPRRSSSNGAIASSGPEDLHNSLSENSVDALDSLEGGGHTELAEDAEAAPPRPALRQRSSSNGEAPPDSLECTPRAPRPRRRSCKSPDSLESLPAERPVPARRLLPGPISKSQERVCGPEASASLEALDRLERRRRRASCDLRPRPLSKSSECFVERPGLLELGLRAADSLDVSPSEGEPRLPRSPRRLPSDDSLDAQDNGNHERPERDLGRDEAPAGGVQASRRPPQPAGYAEDRQSLTSAVSNMTGNLLSASSHEHLQNMLNGNISEVSTDTRSFKEKLIMFEKLGK